MSIENRETQRVRMEHVNGASTVPESRNYTIGIDLGGESYSEGQEIRDSAGNIVSIISTPNPYPSFFSHPTNSFDSFSYSPDGNDSTDTVNKKRIDELTEKVNNLKKLLKDSIQREKQFYTQAKENNKHDNAISDLEIE